MRVCEAALDLLKALRALTNDSIDGLRCAIAVCFCCRLDTADCICVHLYALIVRGGLELGILELGINTNTVNCTSMGRIESCALWKPLFSTVETSRMF